MIQQQLHDYLEAVLWVGGLMFAPLTLAWLVRPIRGRDAFCRSFVRVPANRLIARDPHNCPPAQTSTVADPWVIRRRGPGWSGTLVSGR